MLKKRQGFTLIEMVIVMLIISMLLILIVPNLAAKKDDAQKTANEAVIETIQSEVNMQSPEKIDELKSSGNLEKLEGLTDKQRKVADTLKVDAKGKVVKSSTANSKD